MIDPDEFDAWCELPVTRAVLAELKRIAAERRDTWMRQSWDAGACDERALLMLRGQAEAFNFMAAPEYDRLFPDAPKDRK